MTSLRQMLDGDSPVCAPLVLNPMMAKMAERAGFKALYLGGGATGYTKVYLEANLNISELAQAGTEIRAVSPLPLILDAAAGFGDPMHIHRTMTMAEAAGFAAIEIEDQWQPKRAHHHVGLEHMVPQELMVAKIEEAVAVRRDPEMLIIARTNGLTVSDMDDALKRMEAYRAAGADILLPHTNKPEELRQLGERLGGGGPLMKLLPSGGLATLGMSADEMHGLGYRLLADPQTALLAAFEAMQAYYGEMVDKLGIHTRRTGDWKILQNQIHDTIGIETLLDVERRTVEK